MRSVSAVLSSYDIQSIASRINAFRDRRLMPFLSSQSHRIG